MTYMGTKGHAKLKMTPFACSVVLVGLHWTILWWSCTIDREVGGLEHWNEVRVEFIDLGILQSGAKRKRAHSWKEGKRRLRGGGWGGAPR